MCCDPWTGHRCEERAAKGVSREMCDTWHSCWKRHLHCTATGGACRQQLENIQKGHVEAGLFFFMFKFIYVILKLCLEMYLFPEVTLVDSMGAVPVLLLVCLKPTLAKKGSLGFSLWG